MKLHLSLLTCTLGSAFLGLAFAEEAKDSPAEIAARIEASSEALAEVQDELSADVMELVESQTVPKVIEMLEEVEAIMAEVTDDLIEGETGGPTLAAQTEIIEKILAAAKQKQQSSSEEQSEESKEGMGAMLDMMERMMGKEPGQQQGPPSEGGEQPSEQGEGGGATGESDTANEKLNGGADSGAPERVIPKGSASPGRSLPNEFRKLLDAYNRNDPPSS